MTLPRPLLLLMTLALLPAAARAEDDERFAARTFESRHGGTLLYRLFSPEGVSERDHSRKRYPLILWLHSGGGVGDDNLSQISNGNALGARLWTEPDVQAKHPAFVLAPQCPRGKQWSWHQSGQPTRQLGLAVELILSLAKELPIDLRRIYVVGQSLGGFGAWAAVTAWPRLFAAAVPLCGGGDEEAAEKLTQIGIWAFHGDRDDQVNVERSRRMIEAIRKAGGSPRYTEYKGEGHLIWPRVFSEKGLVEWLFSQRKQKGG